MFIFKTVKVII